MSTTFTVPGLDGITLTATYDAEKSWMRLEGRNAAGDLVSASGFAITSIPIDPITIDPEPAPPVPNPVP